MYAPRKKFSNHDASGGKSSGHSETKAETINILTKVYVKRYKCKKCGLVRFFDGIFYSRCFYGKEKDIVGVSLYLSAKSPFDKNDRVVERYDCTITCPLVHGIALYLRVNFQSSTHCE